MKPDESSRTALMIARQRAAHQALDHGAILYDPFAMKILREDEKDVLQFANAHPLASIGRLITTARSRIAEDALSSKLMSAMAQNPCERRIAAMPAGSKRLTERSSIFLSCSVRSVSNCLSSSEDASGGSM
jgi:hypothetical protein